MKIEGRYEIPASAERIFEALQDPGVLTRCIPGCEKLEETGDGKYKATLKVGIGAIRGTYTGSVAVTDREPVDRLTLAVDGSGAPGFVRGTGIVSLTERDGGLTELAVAGDAAVGGKIAAVGQRMLGGVAKQLMDSFFNRLKEDVSG
jgi:carbon monoxide dehydrogenase subunit G